MSQHPESGATNSVLSDPNVPAPGLETFDITITGIAANTRALVSASDGLGSLLDNFSQAPVRFLCNPLH